MFEEFKDNFKSSDLFQLLFFELNKGNHLVSLINQIVKIYQIKYLQEFI